MLCSTSSVSWASCPMVRLSDKGFATLAEDVVAFYGKTHPGNYLQSQCRRAKRLSDTFHGSQWRLLLKILKAFPETKADVHNPEIVVNVEIRDEIYIYSKIIPVRGMPQGANGKTMLLLSGGIEQPVVKGMAAKRGVLIDAVYFHAPPYTSERAKQKVVDLAKIISRYTGPINLHVVNFTDIQLTLTSARSELTIIMRRYMMRIAEHFAKETKCLGLITGESIGQVASQTTCRALQQPMRSAHCRYSVQSLL